MKVSELMTRSVVSIDPRASLDGAMALMDAEEVRHLPVVDDRRLIGVLSDRDLLETTGWLPKRIREVLEAPTGHVSDFMHSPVVTVSPQDSIVTACMRLVDWNIGCLPVLDDTQLVGMLTESDVLTAYAQACSKGAVPADCDPCAQDVMTTELVRATCDTPAEEALELCHTKGVRHLPVEDRGDVVGIVSDRDLRMCIGRGDLEGTPVGELGPLDLVTISGDSKLSRVAELLVQARIGALPVVVGKRAVGLISAVDVLDHCTQVLADVPGSV